eukprot:SAG31_NODE_632_length_13389_cov_4.818360_7_plen_245_part_00
MAAATQSADSETMRALDQLEVKLTSVLDSLSTINEATTNFNDSQQQPLFEHIQKFQHQLKDLQDLPLPETIQVPLGALDYMDKASNPNLFWRDILRETTATVDANRGKALTLKTLRDNLAQEVAVLQSAKSEPLKPRPLPVLNPEAFDELPMEITEASMAAAAALNEDGSNAAATSMSTNGSALGNANHAASQASTGGANQSNSRSIPGRLDMPNPGEQYEWAQVISEHSLYFETVIQHRLLHW